MTSVEWTFRVASRPAFGGGHVKRCMVLARAVSARAPVRFTLDSGGERWLPFLKNCGFPADIDDPDALTPLKGVVLDHLDTALAAPARWRARAETLICFCDGAASIASADLEIRQWADPTESTPAALAGLSYAVVDPAFAEMGDALLHPRAEHVLVAFGFRDSPNATALVLKSLQALAHVWTPKISVILGADAPNLADVQSRLASFGDRGQLLVDVADMCWPMSQADLVVGGGGVSAAERAAAGRPSVTVALNAAQSAVGVALAKAGATIDLGAIQDLTPELLAEALLRLATDVPARKAMGQAGQSAIDGRGAERIAEAILVPVAA